MILKEECMNLFLYSFFYFICLFPTWFFKFQVFKVEIFLSLSFFITLWALSIFCVFYLKKLNKIKSLYVFTTLIALYGLDNHLSLHRELTNSLSFLTNNFGGPYYASLLLLFLMFIALLLFNFTLKENAAKISLVVIVSLLLTSLFDNKSISNLLNFKKNVSSMSENVKVILIFDEMSGINSYESKTSEGKEFDNLMYSLAKNHNLILFSNVKTKFPSTIKSIGSLVNQKILNPKEFIKEENNNFHYNNTFLKNELFENFKSVSVFQSVHINFCNNLSVKKCKSFNPFEKKKYIEGFKESPLTHFVNAWKYNGSIASLFVWRALRQFNLIDVTLSPQGEKASFVSTLSFVADDIKSKKYDLIFGHFLVPHKPYGFNENCSYEGLRSLGNYNNSLDIEQHTYFHNIDRKCTIIFIDNFLKNLSKEKINFADIYFLSDHGSRNIIDDPSSSLNNIFFIKRNKAKFIDIDKPTILQDEFKKRLFK